jgi:hypothetical protein
MQALLWKTQMAVLWVVAAVAVSAHMILLAFDPVVLKKAGEWAATAGQGEWVVTAMFWLGPLWMAVLAVALGEAAGRWVNVVVAGVYTLLGIWHFLMCGVPVLPGGPFERAATHHVLLVATPAVATALILWLAWRGPQGEAAASGTGAT